MKELTVQACLENIAQVTGWLDEALEELGCPLKTQMQIDVAADEMIANVSQYAYPEGKGSVTIRFEFSEETGIASITFIDQGIPFNPLERNDPDTTLDAQARAIGGLGIFLVKKTMDDMTYQYKDGHNIVCVHKKIRA